MKVLAFDANSIVNRAFYGVRLLTTKDGVYTNAVYGFFNIVYRLVEEQKPDYLAFCFDVHAPTFRHKLYEEYKGTRKGMPEELRVQMPLVKEMLAYLGCPVLEAEGYEADDLLGTIAKVGAERGDEVLICTGDRDSLQLISDKVNVILATNAPGGASYNRMDEAAIREKYGVTPRELIEVKALMGDSSDNIPGVPGIGEKGALSLISQYHSVDYIYEHLEELTVTPSVRRKLTEGKELAYLSRTLGTICQEAPLPPWEEMRPREWKRDELYLFLSRLELSRIIARLKLTPPETLPAAPEAEEAPAAALPLQTAGEAFKPETLTGPLHLAAEFDREETLTGLALLSEEGLFWLPEPREETLRALFLSPEEKIASDSKLLHKTALRLGASLRNLTLDARLAGYLLNPNASDYTALHQLTAEGRGLPEILWEGECPEAVKEAAALRELAPVLRREIRENGQEKLLYEVEQPLAEVLASMELAGFAIDLAGLSEFGAYLDSLTETLVKEIYTLAGHEFNLNSPRQLSVVLFEELGLPARKKTKSGYSTSAEVLESLVPEHPIVSKILEYRKYAKLSSTYVAGLRDTAGADGRIHTSFNQTETRTGRISSTEPNLQNIPIRTEPGSRMREFFSAREGFLLVDADYSQIELRVLAAIAGDEAMTHAFLTGEDIHTNTAAQVFDLPREFVTPLMRSRAKAVNFGIVYGIGAFSLSKDIGVTLQEADQYIKSYKKTYSGINAYLTASIESAKERGYAETLLGRRRYLPELHASNHMQRAFGERVAMNMPIQGTAADIIKVAMVRVYRRLKAEIPEARLILQVHDELIIEAPEQQADAVLALVKEEMEHALELSVPLSVEAKAGKTWADAH